MEDLTGVLVVLGADPEVRAIVIEEAGPVFSAGHDLGEMIGREAAFYRKLFDACTVMMETIHRVPQPVIAKVHGIATAAGCQLVAACDLALAAEATRFATPGVKIGLFCSTPMVPVSRAVGRKRALELLLTGDPIDAETACEWRLINPGRAGRRTRGRGVRTGRESGRVERPDREDRQGGLLRADRSRRARRLFGGQRGDGLACAGVPVGCDEGNQVLPLGDHPPGSTPVGDLLVDSQKA
jgi:hypothetical protein